MRRVLLQRNGFEGASANLSDDLCNWLPHTGHSSQLFLKRCFQAMRSLTFANSILLDSRFMNPKSPPRYQYLSKNPQRFSGRGREERVHVPILFTLPTTRVEAQMFL